jgi:aldehyde dehydrogenase (NAD+)
MTDERWTDPRPVPPASEYAPAPESRDVVTLRSLRAVHRRRVRRPRSTASTSRRSTRRPRRCSPRSPRPARPTSTARSRPRARVRRVLVEDARRERGSTCSGSRASSRSAREFAVLETLDGGKPIKESRDVDVPARAAHFFYYAGWADKLEYAFPGRTPRRSASRPDHPVELPAADAAWKIAPALACGNTVVLKPAETTPLTALLFARSASRPTCRPASSTSSPARRDRRGARRAPTSTRSRSPARPRSASRSRAIAGTGKRSRSSSAARPPTSSSTTRRSTRPSRASSTASTSTRATSAAPARGCSCRSRSPTRSSSKAARPPWRRCARRPARQEHRHRRDQLAPQLERIRELVAERRGRGRERWSAAVRAARAGYWFRRRVSPASRRAHRIARRRSSGRCCRC